MVCGFISGQNQSKRKREMKRSGGDEETILARRWRRSGLHFMWEVVPGIGIFMGLLCARANQSGPWVALAPCVGDVGVPVP